VVKPAHACYERQLNTRVINLDLWAEGAAQRLPAITVTPAGLRFEGAPKEFDRLCLILGGWLKG
jgi:hypothetical protein